MLRAAADQKVMRLRFDLVMLYLLCCTLEVWEFLGQMDGDWCAGLPIGTVSKAGAHRARGEPLLTLRGSTEPLLEIGRGLRNPRKGITATSSPAHA